MSIYAWGRLSQPACQAFVPDDCDAEVCPPRQCATALTFIDESRHQGANAGKATADIDYTYTSAHAHGRLFQQPSRSNKTKRAFTYRTTADRLSAALQYRTIMLTRNRRGGHASPAASDAFGVSPTAKRLIL